MDLRRDLAEAGGLPEERSNPSAKRLNWPGLPGTLVILEGAWCLERVQSLTICLRGGSEGVWVLDKDGGRPVIQDDG